MRTILYWLLVILTASSCTPQRFSIGKGISVESIKIEPSKSVYRVERYA